jgi:Protein of unknown function (DUF3577)
MSATQNTATQQSSNFIDLHINGLGYLRRVRSVTPRGSKSSYWAGEIGAMYGEKGVKDGVKFLNLDTHAVTEQAETVLSTLQADANNQDLRVMVQFKAGDPFIDSFTLTKGPNAGQVRTVLKARLLLIRRAWVKSANNGDDQSGWKLVYELPKQDAAPAEEAEGTQNTGTNG